MPSELMRVRIEIMATKPRYSPTWYTSHLEFIPQHALLLLLLVVTFIAVPGFAGGDKSGRSATYGASLDNARTDERRVEIFVVLVPPGPYARKTEGM
jgi:hypothetical protein